MKFMGIIYKNLKKCIKILDKYFIKLYNSVYNKTRELKYFLLRLIVSQKRFIPMEYWSLEVGSFFD